MNPKARRKARKLVLQALYQWYMTAAESAVIRLQYLNEKKMETADKEYFIKLIDGVIQNVEALDKAFEGFLDRPIDQLNPIELSVLRIAAFEMEHCLDVPYKVVINEAVELTKTFGAQDGYKYVNGVVHKLANQLRQAEIKQA